MGKVLIEESTLTAIGDSIRGKTGKTAKIPPLNMPSEISGIETGGNYQAKTATPSTSAQTIKPDSGYDALSEVTVNAMPTATQATPSISVSSAGLITASAAQSAGYVAAGTKSATKQLSTQAAKTVTPTTSNQTAVASGKYTTGAITVKGDANLKAANIASGVSIFGVAGSLPKVATGTFEITEWDREIVDYPFTVSGLPFKPSSVDIFYTGLNNSNGGDPTWGIYQIDNSKVFFVHNDPYYDEELDEDVDDWCFWHTACDDGTAAGVSDYKVHFIMNSDGFTIKADDCNEYANELRLRRGIYKYIARS